MNLSDIEKLPTNELVKVLSVVCSTMQQRIVGYMRVSTTFPLWEPCIKEGVSVIVTNAYGLHHNHNYTAQYMPFPDGKNLQQMRDEGLLTEWMKQNTMK